MKITIVSSEQLVGERPTNYDHFKCDAIALDPVKVMISRDLEHHPMIKPITGISTMMIAAIIREKISKKKDGDRLVLPVVGRNQPPAERILGMIKESQRSPRSIKLLVSKLAELSIPDQLLKYPYGACRYCGSPIRIPGEDADYCVNCEWLPVKPGFKV